MSDWLTADEVEDWIELGLVPEEFIDFNIWYCSVEELFEIRDLLLNYGRKDAPEWFYLIKLWMFVNERLRSEGFDME